MVRLKRKQDSVVGVTFQGGTEVNPFTMIYLFREARNKTGKSILSFHSLISSAGDASSLTFTNEEEHVTIKSNKLLVARVLIRKLVIPVDREPMKGDSD